MKLTRFKGFSNSFKYFDRVFLVEYYFSCILVKMAFMVRVRPRNLSRILDRSVCNRSQDDTPYQYLRYKSIMAYVSLRQIAN